MTTYDSVLAHGTVDNLTFTAQLQPIAPLTGVMAAGGVWQAQFFAHSNWLYTLERSTDLRTLGAGVCIPTPGNEGFMMLQDADPPSPGGVYRVWAQQP